jgi:hypothetical protein
MKTSELKGAALDWAVAKCLTIDSCLDAPEMIDKLVSLIDMEQVERFSTDWSQGGPIIEREFIELTVMPCGRANTTPTTSFDTWLATKQDDKEDSEGWWETSGPTPLVAAMRCFVASKLGDEIE